MTRENLKLVVSDIDGTLINDNDELPHNFIEMVDKLNDLDIVFVAASGRGVESIKSKLSYESENLYIISDNGALITQNDKVIYINTFSRDDYIEIIDVFETFNNITIAVATQSVSYVKIPNDKAVDYKLLDEFYKEYEIVDDLKDRFGDCVSFSIHCPNGAKNIFESDIVQKAVDKHRILLSGERWIDAVPPNTDKGHSLKNLIQILEIDKTQTIAFGDYNNDIGMLSFVEKGYAMKDATELLKSVADEVIGSNNDNSVVNKILNIIN